MTDDLIDRLEGGLRLRAETFDVPPTSLVTIRQRYQRRLRKRAAMRMAGAAAAIVAVVGVLATATKDAATETAAGPPALAVTIVPLTDDIETGIYGLDGGGDVLLGFVQDVGLAVSTDGEAWFPSTPPSATESDEPQIVLATQGLLMVAGQQMREGGTVGVIDVSTDGGRSWSTEELPDALDLAIIGTTVHDGRLHLAGNVIGGRYSVSEAMAEIRSLLDQTLIEHDDVTFRRADGSVESDDPDQPDAENVIYELRLDGAVVSSGRLSDVGVPDDLSHRAFGGGDPLEDRGTVVYTRPIEGGAWERTPNDDPSSAGIFEPSISTQPIGGGQLFTARGEDQTTVYVSQNAREWTRLAVPDRLIAQQVFVGPHGVFAVATPESRDSELQGQVLHAPSIEDAGDPDAWRPVAGIPSPAGTTWIADTEAGVLAATWSSNGVMLTGSTDGINFAALPAPDLTSSDAEAVKVVALADGRIFGLVTASGGDNSLNRLIRLDVSVR